MVFIDCYKPILSSSVYGVEEYYNSCRENGQTIQQALDSTSHYLGHGSDRNDLMKQYVEEIK